MSEAAVVCEVDGRGVVTAALNRPDNFNGLGGEILRQLAEILDRCEQDAGIRALCLRARGKHFSAGADVKRLGAAAAPAAAAAAAAPSIPEVLQRLDALRVPTLALVQGACIGGAAALVACCDVVVAASDALFGIPEVRLGIPPLALLRYLLPVMGQRQLRRYALTGERFDAAEACRIGLVHQICAAERLSDTAAPVIDALLRGEPLAVSETKAGIAAVLAGTGDDAAWEKQTDEKMSSPAVREGIAAFREKREPRWYPGQIKSDPIKQ